MTGRSYSNLVHRSQAPQKTSESSLLYLAVHLSVLTFDFRSPDFLATRFRSRQILWALAAPHLEHIHQSMRMDIIVHPT